MSVIFASSRVCGPFSLRLLLPARWSVFISEVPSAFLDGAVQVIRENLASQQQHGCTQSKGAFGSELVLLEQSGLSLMLSLFGVRGKAEATWRWLRISATSHITLRLAAPDGHSFIWRESGTGERPWRRRNKAGDGEAFRWPSPSQRDVSVSAYLAGPVPCEL